ncbi:hypothetical protein CVT24_002411 [Panaeolus cyanescens]|uniref:Uncharacterized protein n=1 Tax=Panaeolus cyanescens TaxID=181874 RepID=A0A409W0X2_9AGAR|nr:hypothetical protein CVT24_002411 [Panaeolus cyanescens]
MVLAKVSLCLRSAVQRHCRSTYRIEDELAEFFDDVEIRAFRAMQEETGLIISGSFALRFVSRQRFDPDSDLDLYVEDVHAMQALQWLASIGYVTQRGFQNNVYSSAWPRPAMSTRTRTSNLRAAFTMYREGKKVQVMVTWQSTVGVVLQFHSTCVMNIITSNKAYCLYPRATLVDKRSLVVRRPDFLEQRSADAIHKYHQRGYSMEYIVENERDISSPRSAYCVGPRSVGDSKCWVLDIQGSETSPTSLGSDQVYVEGNAWRLVKSASRPGRLRHSFHSLHRYDLKFSYILDQWSHQHQQVSYRLRHLCYSGERWVFGFLLYSLMTY